MASLLQTVSTVEALEEELERRILEGELEPGTHLRETELAEEYEVGRHTLRAAFGALVRRGLLVKEPNRGVFVRVLTADDLVEIYDFRTAIEAQVFRILAADGRVPEAAHIAVGRLSMLGPRSPRRKIVEADLAFHRALVEASGNSRLVRAHEQLDAEIVLCLAQLVRGYARPDQLADEHGELIEAIQSRRASVAERAIRGHFERATEWLVAQIGD